MYSKSVTDCSLLSASLVSCITIHVRIVQSFPNFLLIRKKSFHFVQMCVNTRSAIGVILTHSIKLFAYFSKIDSNREVKLPDFS